MPASTAPVAVDSEAASPAGATPETPEQTLAAQQRKRVRLASWIGVVLGGTAFYVTLLDYGHNLLRGATGFGYAEQFFDLQATAIMHGHLWVPKGSLGIEGFVVGGHTYSYFGIFPALLRIPVQLVTHEYDGRLSLISMGIAWVLFAYFVVRLFWLVREVLSPGRLVGRVDLVLAVVFLAAATGGTTLTFDGSLPWVFNEVYVWSVASVLGSLYWLLRVIVGPTSPTHVRWLLVLTLMASLTRTTGGWAVCLVTIAAGVWYLRRQPSTSAPRVWGQVALVGAVSLSAGIVINLIKFHHPFLFPLEDQVFTSVNAHRREVLAQNNGTLAGIQFLPTSLVSYFRLDGIRFTGYYPWITLPATPATGVHVEIDQGYRTGSVPAVMPLLFLLTLASLPMMFRRLPTLGHRGVRLVFVGAVIMTGGVMDYGYIAFRYTSEFVPGLVIGGMVALHTLSGWAARRPRGIRVGLVAVCAVLTAYSVALQLAVGHTAAATTFKGPKLEAYVHKQLELSGSTKAYADLVHHSDALPTGGHADDLWIRGDCDALYFNTGGDDDVPWTLVQERDSALVVRTSTAVKPGLYPLMHHTLNLTRSVSLRVTADRQAQVVIDDDGLLTKGQLFDLPPDAEIRIGSRNLSEFGSAEIRSTPGGLVGYVPTAEFIGTRATLASVVPDSESVVRKPGISISPAPTLPLPLCRSVAKAAGVDTSSTN